MILAMSLIAFRLGNKAQPQNRGRWTSLENHPWKRSRVGVGGGQEVSRTWQHPHTSLFTFSVTRSFASFRLTFPICKVRMILSIAQGRGED